MAPMTQLDWLPTIDDWRERLRRLGEVGDKTWDEAVALANSRLDMVRTNAVDMVVRRTFGEPPKAVTEKPVRLALLGSSTRNAAAGAPTAAAPHRHPAGPSHPRLRPPSRPRSEADFRQYGPPDHPCRRSQTGPRMSTPS